MNPVRPKLGQRPAQPRSRRWSGWARRRPGLRGRAPTPRDCGAPFDDLAARFDVVVAEGAVMSTQLARQRLREHGAGPARRPPLWSSVTSTGGSFVSMFGTVAQPDDQRLIAGFVVNKFRADLSLLQPGLTQLEELTGRRVYGVLPWHPDVWLDSEYALDLSAAAHPPDRGTLKVAVVRLPRISNFTDVDALGLEPGLDVVFAADPACGLRRGPGGAARHPSHHRRPRLAAGPRPRPGDPVARARPSGARRLRRLPDAAAQSPTTTASRGCRRRSTASGCSTCTPTSWPEGSAAARCGRWARARAATNIHHGRRPTASRSSSAAPGRTRCRMMLELESDGFRSASLTCRAAHRARMDPVRSELRGP